MSTFSYEGRGRQEVEGIIYRSLKIYCDLIGINDKRKSIERSLFTHHFLFEILNLRKPSLFLNVILFERGLRLRLIQIFLNLENPLKSLQQKIIVLNFYICFFADLSAFVAQNLLKLPLNILDITKKKHQYIF